MAQRRLGVRSTGQSGRSAACRSISRADASAVVVNGGRIISGDHSGRENMTGGSWRCCSSCGFGCRLWAGGDRCGGGGQGVGDGEVGGVVRFAV